jgi:regulator of cell morphogenesis and NO signaling
MTINTMKTVRELAVELPGATRIFEELGIDYCCGGERSLQEACLAAGVLTERAVYLLDRAELITGEGMDGGPWAGRPLSKLTSYIISKHHAFAMEKLVRLSRLFPKVCSAHARNHPELLRLQFLFQSLAEELTEHMQKEEQILFPYIEQMEDAVRRSEPVPTPFFGTVHHPVRGMVLEHDNAGQVLRKMRRVSSGYSVPADGCTSFKALYQALEAFERDLHQHVHLENNILFPRALEMENQILSIAKVSQEHFAGID